VNKNLFIKLNEKNNLISEVLLKAKLKDLPIGLFSGLTGIMLYHALSYKATEDQIHMKRIEELLDLAMVKINAGEISYTLCDGLAGFCWFMDFLYTLEIFDFDNDEFLKQFDDLLIKKMKNNTHINNIDFLHGNLGILFYFIERWKKTSNRELKIKYTEIVNNQVKYFISISEKNNLGLLFWRTNFNLDSKRTAINFGLAHGIPSIIRILQIIDDYCIPLYDNYLDHIINQSCQFLYENRNNITFKSQYPSWILNSEINHDSRLGWCYGDIGIGLTYLYSKTSFFNKEAINIFNKVIERKTVKETSVEEGCFCHGAFGIAYIYQKLYKNFKNIDYKNYSLFWYERGLEMGSNELGFAGYLTQTRGKSNWEGRYDLLTGISGIGLSILYAIYELNYNWDKCLLI